MMQLAKKENPFITSEIQFSSKIKKNLMAWASCTAYCTDTCESGISQDLHFFPFPFFFSFRTIEKLPSWSQITKFRECAISIGAKNRFVRSPSIRCNIFPSMWESGQPVQMWNGLPSVTGAHTIFLFHLWRGRRGEKGLCPACNRVNRIEKRISHASIHTYDFFQLSVRLKH